MQIVPAFFEKNLIDSTNVTLICRMKGWGNNRQNRLMQTFLLIESVM